MHRRCRHDSSEKSSTFPRFGESTQTSLDSDWKGHEYKDDSNEETQSQDEVGCDSTETGHGKTARYDFKIQHRSRSLLQGDVAPLESKVKYGLSRELGQNDSQSPQPVDIVPSEPQKFGSGEHATFDPGGQNPVDHVFFQHGSILYQPSCDVSSTETIGSDANARHKCVDGRSGKTSQDNLVYRFQPRSLTRNEISRFSGEDLTILDTSAFEESDTTMPEKGNGVLEFCYYFSSMVSDCGTERQLQEPRFRRAKHLGRSRVGCRNGFDRSLWTNDFGFDCYDTRPINMGWDIAFIFEIEESPFIYNVCFIEMNAVTVLRKRKKMLRSSTKKKKKCRVGRQKRILYLKISSAFALHVSSTESPASAGFHNACPLNERLSIGIKSVPSSKINVVSLNDDSNGLTELGNRILTSDVVEFCKRIYPVRGHYKFQRITSTNLRLSGSAWLCIQSKLPGQIVHVDKTCVSCAGSGKKVLDWRDLLSDVVLSGYRRICCISDSSRGESIIDCLRLDLRQYGCQVLNIDDRS